MPKAPEVPVNCILSPWGLGLLISDYSRYIYIPSGCCSSKNRLMMHVWKGKELKDDSMLVTFARETSDLAFLLKFGPSSCCQFRFRERLLPPAYTHTDATLLHTQNNHWPSVPQNTISAIWSEQAGDGGPFDVSLIPPSLLQLLLALFRGGYRTGLPRPHYPTNTTQHTHSSYILGALGVGVLDLVKHQCLGFPHGQTNSSAEKAPD